MGAAEGLWQAIAALVTFLSDPDKEIQVASIEALRKITGQQFGFDADASRKNNEKAIEAWHDWCRDNHLKVGPRKAQ